MATIALVALALARPAQPALAADASGEAIAPRPARLVLSVLAALALASSLVTWRFASWAAAPRAPRPEVLACALVPLLVAASAAVLLLLPTRSRARPPTQAEAESGVARGLVAVLAVVPLLLMVAVSRHQDALVDRGTVVFLPYLLVLVAAGARACGRSPWLPALVASGLLATSVASLAHYRRAQATPRDYAGLARSLGERLRPGDVVVVGNDYRDPPLFYYFPENAWRRFVPTRDPARVASVRRPERMWVVTWKNPRPGGEPSLRLHGYLLAGEVGGRYAARALLYVRAPTKPRASR